MSAVPPLPGDVARQLATCAAALAQVAMPVLLPPRFDADQRPPDVIQPSPAAFAVWLPIFAASLGYAGYQLRPSARAQTLPRRVGWPLAAAFACTGAWAPLLRARQYWGAQCALVGVAVAAQTARHRLGAAEVTTGLNHGTRLAVVPVTGMLAAWGAAAAGVNLASMLQAYGLVRPGRQSVIAGNLLVLALGAFGAGTVVPGAPVTSRAYAATLVWAFVGIAIGQRRRSPSAAIAAAVSTAAVLGSMARPRPS